jgi:hypothetical protein
MLRRTAFAAAAALAATLLVGPVGPADATTVTARQLLARVDSASEAGSSTYDRDKFPHWIDADGDGCNTRAEVLQKETRARLTYSSRCTVYRGKWYSWYDGATWTYASDVDIDHVVALKEAWESGARGWTLNDRRRFANDLGYAWSLDAVTDNVNQSKSDKDPADWMPPLSSVRCTYAIHWTAVKYRWRLTINPRERDKLRAMFAGSCGDRLVSLPARAR